MITAFKVASAETYVPNQLFSVDALGAIVMLIIALVGLAATIYSVQYLRDETAKEIVGFTRVKQYFILLNLFLAAMFMAVVSSNPVITWISVEATTLSTAFIISFYNKPSAMEAAWKYLIINSIGLLLGFFGTLLYFTSSPGTGEAGFTTWNILLSNAAHLNPLIIKIAFIFILIGYGTKVGLVPMHTWLPDAHSKAPAPISALLSGVLLNVALMVVLRFKLITDAVVVQSFSQHLLIVFGFLSIVIAALINFTQKNYKRLLAYHSIENMGIAALGFGFGGLGVFMAILHMIYHAVVKSALFLSAGTILLKYCSSKIIKVKGVLTALPITGILFLAGFFIITGTPPFGMFLTKVLILSVGIKDYPVVGIASLFFAAMLFIAFFDHATAMVFGEKTAGIETGEGSIWLLIPPLALIAVVVCLSFYIPPFLSTLINQAAAHN
ncbi:MAG: proton-conducting transporter membrane subunit [Smithellaceae bacterium]|nr:proton-conducting transporter membrane subunit [Smithellaceae bacterium]